MEITCLLGSPRAKGNSGAMAAHFLAAAEALGATTRSFALNALRYRGCQACFLCKTKLDRCGLEDDLSEVLEAIRETDVLVMATPIYFGEVSGQLKSCFDRTFSFLVPDYVTSPHPSRLPPGKQWVFLASQGHPDEKSFADVYPRYAYFMQWFGFAKTYCVRACGVREAGEVKERPDVLEQLAETARQVMAAGT